MKITENENWILLGATSGLGAAFQSWILQNGLPVRVASYSRQTTPSFDFSDETTWKALAHQISQDHPTRIFYFAGGGPWGPFAKKKWSSHRWALNVTYACPAFLLHHFSESGVAQFVVVGSAVAESQPDANAASYSAAKHALLGLVKSLWAEKSMGQMDLRLLSPGYLDTPMLPKHAHVRDAPGLVADPRIVADRLGRWILDSQSANSHLCGRLD